MSRRLGVGGPRTETLERDETQTMTETEIVGGVRRMAPASPVDLCSGVGGSFFFFFPRTYIHLPP